MNHCCFYYKMKKDVFDNLYGIYSLDNYLTKLGKEREHVDFGVGSTLGLGLTVETCTFSTVDGSMLTFSNLVGLGNSFLGAKVAEMTSKRYGLKDTRAIFNIEAAKNILIAG